VGPGSQLRDDSPFEPRRPLPGRKHRSRARGLRGTVHGGTGARPAEVQSSRRIVGIPSSIIPALREHLSLFVGPEAEALNFPGSRAARCAAAISTGRPGRTPSARLAPKPCTPTEHVPFF